MTFVYAIVVITLVSLVFMALYASSVQAGAWATGLCILLIAASLYWMFSPGSGTESSSP